MTRVHSFLLFWSNIPRLPFSRILCPPGHIGSWFCVLRSLFYTALFSQDIILQGSLFPTFPEHHILRILYFHSLWSLGSMFLGSCAPEHHVSGSPMSPPFLDLPKVDTEPPPICRSLSMSKGQDCSILPFMEPKQPSLFEENGIPKLHCERLRNRQSGSC